MIDMPYILAHFIGDFLLQSDGLAAGKKISSAICTIHVVLYMVPFFCVDIGPIQFVLIALQHWLQDRYGFIAWYCRNMDIFQSELLHKGLPWGHFVVDQIFHFIWLWLVMDVLANLLT